MFLISKFKKNILKKITKIINSKKHTHSDAISYTFDIFMCYWLYKKIQRQKKTINFKDYFSLRIFSDFGTFTILFSFFCIMIYFHSGVESLLSHTDLKSKMSLEEIINTSKQMRFFSFLTFSFLWSAFIFHEFLTAFKLILVKEIENNQYFLNDFLLEEKALFEKDTINRQISKNKSLKVKERRRL